MINVYPPTVYSLVVSGNNVFAGTDAGIFLSPNNGTDWLPVNTGLTKTTISSLAVSGSNIFAGTNGGGVFISNNNGNNWSAFSSGLPNTSTINSLVVGRNNIFAGTSDSGVWSISVITGDVSGNSTPIELYPNPAKDWLTISLGDEGLKKEVTINNMIGQSLASQEVTDKEVRFQIENYSQGIYFAKVLVNGSSQIIKFVKE